MEVPEFNFQQHVVIPISYFDKLLKSHYGKSEEENSQVVYKGESTENHTAGLADAELKSIMGPGNFVPGGVAKKKRRNINGLPYVEATEGQESPSKAN
ncbi:MAG TPA: hypothetical protein DF712_23175 [Balneola sp.]|nr:hypothetical protein [Balneola sp.]|tara:strand:- start:784 stop:1077 length:294 start_codon:yes stop_codon:yes gene_type:complete